MTTLTDVAQFIYFDKYATHYYSQSSAPWEAAYINCFDSTDKDRHVGYMVFTYANGTFPPGQENELNPGLPTQIPPGQHNHLDSVRAPFFVIYYDLSRFGDVMNILQHCVPGEKGMLASADPVNHVWALCNNDYVPVGAR